MFNFSELPKCNSSPWTENNEDYQNDFKAQESQNLTIPSLFKNSLYIYKHKKLLAYVSKSLKDESQELQLITYFQMYLHRYLSRHFLPLIDIIHCLDEDDDQILHN